MLKSTDKNMSLKCFVSSHLFEITCSVALSFFKDYFLFKSSNEFSSTVLEIGKIPTDCNSSVFRANADLNT